MKKLPDDFYKEEIKYGYLITEKMKKVWSVQLDLLDKFSSVCEENGLNYFIDGGTLLGAVRHEGFIPWDDDVDVIMPRQDYIHLCRIAEDVFDEPYFFQTTISEHKSNFIRMHAQLRNSETTGFIRQDECLDINKGIFLDIFILDGVPNSVIKRALFKKIIRRIKKIFECINNIETNGMLLKDKLYWNLFKSILKGENYYKFFILFHNHIMGWYSKKETKYIGDLTLDWRENVIWKTEWFRESVYLNFENLKLRAPIDYSEVLYKQYGEYLKFPEDITNTNSHGKLILEPNIPYYKYLREQK